MAVKPLTTSFRIVITITTVCCCFALAAAQPREIRYQDLSLEIKNHISQVRKACTELNPDFKPFDVMQGVTVVDLKGDHSVDIMVDNEGLCNDATAGANCSNRGCDLTLWKQIGPQTWRKVFNAHLHRKFISLNRDTNRFQLMAVSIYAGDKRCEPDPRGEYTSGMSCDLLVYYRDDRWIWQKIR